MRAPSSALPYGTTIQATAADRVATMLRAQSIAVIGASGRRGTFGHNVVTYLAETGYRGRIYPVNPRYSEIEDLACYAAIGDVPETVDCAVLAVSDDKLEAALDTVASAGARSAVIFGMAVEKTRTGLTPLTERLAAIAHDTGMAICGGNCMGFLNFLDNVMVGGWPYKYPPPKGHIAIISHSGSSYSALALNARQLGLSHLISSGQELATTAADYIEFLLTQKETHVIGCILETVRDPERFRAAVDAADRQGVPIVILKLGRSQHGTAMARAHSGALAGSQIAHRAIFERHNIISVQTLDDFANTLELFACERIPATDEIALVTDSGGERTMIVDIADDLGIRWAPLSDETTQVLKDNLDEGLAPVNPLDVWGTGHDHERIARTCLRALADDSRVGQVIFASNMLSGRELLTTWSRVAEAVHANTTKPIVMLGNLSSAFDREEAARLRSFGIPVMLGTDSGLRAVAAVIFWHQRHREQRIIAPKVVPTQIVEHWRARLANAGASLDTFESLALAANFGIPTAPARVANSEIQLRRISTELRFPVVLKTLSPGIDHKFDAGGVVLGIRTQDELLEAWRSLAVRLGPNVLVQETAPAGVEIFLGLTVDPQWGPLITIGLGGIFVEILRDVVTLVPPVDAQLALKSLRQLQGFAVLNGARGRKPVDLSALAEVIASFSGMAAALGPALAEMDINPIIAGPHGAIAVDALAVPFSGNAVAEVH
jgi:acetate---CoA ligase (ADP-forming)